MTENRSVVGWGGTELQQNTKKLKGYGNVIILTAVKTALWVYTDNETNQLLYFHVFYASLKIKWTIKYRKHSSKLKFNDW